MFRLIRTHVRPNVSVAFFDPTTSPEIKPELKQYIWETYMSTGRLVDNDNTLSEDGLTSTFTSIWDEEASAMQFKEDPYIIEHLLNIQTAYNAANNITQELVSKDTI